jgi:RAB protein geranylgeranyltransferase component A
VIDGLEYIRSITEESRNVYLLTAAIDLLKEDSRQVAELREISDAKDVEIGRLQQATTTTEYEQAVEIERLTSLLEDHNLMQTDSSVFKIDEEVVDVIMERLTRMRVSDE